MFSTTDLSALRAVAELAMPDTCVLYTAGTASDAYDNAGSVTYTASGTVRCRVQPLGLNPQERAAAGQLLGLDYYAVHVPHDTNLGSVTRIGYSGGSVEVSGTASPRSYQYDVTVDAVRISG